MCRSKPLTVTKDNFLARQAASIVLANDFHIFQMIVRAQLTCRSGKMHTQSKTFEINIHANFTYHFATFQKGKKKKRATFQNLMETTKITNHLIDIRLPTT